MQALNFIKSTIHTVREVTSIARNGRSYFSSYFHSMPAVLRRYENLPTALVSVDGLTIEGYSLTKYLRMIFDYNFLFDEISQWRLNFSISKLLEGSFAKAFSYYRIPTLRELISTVFEDIVYAFSSTKTEILKLLAFLQRHGKKLFIAMAISYIIFAINLFMKKNNYKAFDPTSADPINHRPNQVRNMIPRNVVPMDVTGYPARNREIAQDLLDQVNAVDYQLNNPTVIACACMKGKNNITQCVCTYGTPPVPINGPSQMIHNRLLETRHKLARQLQHLSVDRDAPSFVAGQTMKYELYPSTFYVLLKALLGVSFKVTWTLRERFEVVDTRPTHERHISQGPSAFWVIEQNNTRGYIDFMGYRMHFHFPRRHLRFFQIPSRDLVVSEDHIRSQRRGALSTDFDTSLKAILQTSMAIPINDPNFVVQKIDPMRDAYLVARAIHGKYVPSYWDF